ncbi:CAZyme family AA3 [Paecilomyces variotii]|nr:CAZyme family AA3 [Paecilomyces variotii]KAJ9197415.1 CAZyme family AA3 [Paecilomyces variotii]KAJ9274409.1 CAZyme family AA3 [Paecilomyces variotii]KAJ9311031.1 CAZyme family AA3 [Paecilomyces variotii]KAJ9341412.1 CAZyme family AA3 [Paecilomyces variotii]
MADETASIHVPLDVPLPALPTEKVFTDGQWKTLLALADTAIPSIRDRATVTHRRQKGVPKEKLESAIATLKSRIGGPNAAELAKQYLEEDASSNPNFRDALHVLFARNIHSQGKKALLTILSALNTRAGSLVLTGSPTPFHLLTNEAREQTFRNWETSMLSPLRFLYRMLTSIFKKTWVASSPTLSPVLGFPRVPVNGKPAESFPYEFLQFPPGDTPQTVETDVVIIGSGCGGGVAAKNLAEAGHRVIVVDKSYHYSTKYFPMGQAEGFTHMLENSGATVSDDGSIAVIAGSTWGGGGTINWSASLQTQGFVRQEWASNGLPFFTSMEFQKSLDRVCDRMGVCSDRTPHNRSNTTILDGARKLGYSAKAVPQNTGNQEHYCGHCMLGCASNVKQGPAVSFLVDAANAGATFMEGFRADRVLFTDVDGEKVASGVEGTWTSRDSYLGVNQKDAVKCKVIIKAKRVIVSCGTLNSPLLLQRSGIKNSHIGRHLYLHPVIMAGAVFEEDIRPWEGGILTTLVNQFENLDGHGHGARVEATCMLPATFLPLFPWSNGFDYKMWASKMRQMTSFIVIARERDTGRVFPDPVDGRPRIDYTVSPFDLKHIQEGVIAAAQIAYAAGAKEYHLSYRGMPPFIRSDEPKGPDVPDEGINNPAFQEWISEFRRQTPLNPERSVFASAHQMGTCRMGSSPKKSVVDPDCQVWGTRGLYVIDASVFPSASGVNPMVTNMAIADWASRNVARGISREQGARL